MSMTATESTKFSNISATTAAFGLSGGKYLMVANATWGGGSATLQIQGADGTTYVTALTAFSADGVKEVSLPPGQFKVAVATATGVYVSITRIPA